MKLFFKITILRSRLKINMYVNIFCSFIKFNFKISKVSTSKKLVSFLKCKTNKIK